METIIKKITDNEIENDKICRMKSLKLQKCLQISSGRVRLL